MRVSSCHFLRDRVQADIIFDLRPSGLCQMAPDAKPHFAGQFKLRLTLDAPEITTSCLIRMSSRSHRATKEDNRSSITQESASRVIFSSGRTELCFNKHFRAGISVAVKRSSPSLVCCRVQQLKANSIKKRYKRIWNKGLKSGQEVQRLGFSFCCYPFLTFNDFQLADRFSYLLAGSPAYSIKSPQPQPWAPCLNIDFRGDLARVCTSIYRRFNCSTCISGKFC